MAKDFKAIVNVAGKVDGSLDKSLATAQKKIGSMNKALIASAAAAAGAIAAVGKKLFDLANEYDGAIDKITFGTGAAGDALAGLQKDFEAVYENMPTSMDSAATAISDLNTRLGLSGETLQEVARQSIQLSEALGAGELSAVIEKSAGALQQFQVDQEDMSAAMDHAFKVSQSTGIGYNELMQELQKNGPVLQSLNYDFEEAATLLGSLKKSGVDSASAMSALNKAVQFASEKGQDAGVVMEKYYEQIKNAESETKAMKIATEIFGKKGATTMTKAIRSGALAITDLNNALLANTDTIDSTVSATYDGFDEQVQLMRNRMTLATRDIADKINKAVEQSMPRIGALLDRLVPVIEKIGDKAVPAIDGIISVVEGLTTALEWGIDNWDLLGPAVYTALKAFVAYKSIKFATDLYSTGKAVYTLTKNFGLLTLAKIKDKGESLFLMGLYAKEAAAKGLVTAATVAHTVATTAASVATWSLNAAIAVLTSPITLIIAAFAAVVAAGVLVYKNFDKIKEIAGTLGSYIKDAFVSLVGIIKSPVNTIIGMINGVIDKINSVGFVIPDWVPVLGGKAFSVNIPHLPMLAEGGFTNGVSIAGEAGTEAVISFDRAVRQQNIDYWEQAGVMLGTLDSTGSLTTGGGEVVYDIGNINFTPTINVSGNVTPEAIADKLRQLGPEFTDMIIDALEEKRTGGYVYG